MRGARLAWAACVVLAACSARAPDKPAPGAGADDLPKITITPKPGVYQTYKLAVTVTTDPDHELFFAFATAPVITPGRGKLEKLELNLIHSTVLRVAVRAPSGKVFGPYDYAFELVRVNPDGLCELTPPAKEFYRATETIYFALQYIYSNALSRLEYGVNGDWKTLSTDDYQGTLDLEVGPLAEGVHTVQCRMVSGDNAATSAAVQVNVDGTPPTGAWVDGAFTFNQTSWRNVLEVSASDAFSGLQSVDICNAATAACLPMATTGSTQYFFATALTDGTRLTSQLYVKLADRAGNVRLLPTQLLDLLDYADPVPPRAPKPITVTTAAAFDIASFIGASPSEVRRFDGSVPAESATALALEPGWNEFLYRQASSDHWHSVAAYRGGVEALLPPTAGQWLVFSSGATVPGLQARLEEIITPVDIAATTKFSRPWLASVPNLFFVEDTDGDSRWTQADTLFHDPATQWTDRQRAFGEPVLIAAPAAFTPATFTFSRQVTVSAAAGLPAGDLYFEWRDSLGAFPSYHARLAPAAFPRPVSVPADGVCLFFLDTDDRGAPSAAEPRAWGPCSQDDFVVAARPGALEARDVSPYPLPWIHGIPYGGEVTGVITVTDALGQALVRYPTAVVADGSGLGAEGYREGFETRYPQLPMQVDFYIGAEAASWGPLAAGETPPPGVIAVSVTDGAGAPVQALVVSRADAQERYAAGDAGGQASVAVGGAAPYELYAARDGWLSVKAVTDATSADLTLLAPALTGRLAGVVGDDGAAIAGAELTWENERYRASTISRSDGSYALPASGGDGVLSVTLRAPSSTRSMQYALTVTSAEVEFHPALRPLPNAADPVGLTQGYPPTSISGPATATVAADNYWYSAAFSAPATGAWSVDWLGFKRHVTLPGALPQFPPVAWSQVALPAYGGALTWLNSYLRCGDWEQPVADAVLEHWSCWHWIGDDDLQYYSLGRSVAGAYPAHAGFGVVQGELTQADGSPLVTGTTLRFVDRLLEGRTILVRVTNGVFSAAVPAGVYDVRDENDNPVYAGYQFARVTVAENALVSAALHLGE